MTVPVEYEIDGVDVDDPPRRWITAADDALGVPSLRGEDILIPDAEGETFEERVLGPAYEEFTVFVYDADEDLGVFHDNLRALRQLLFKPAVALQVTKRIHYASGTVVYGPSPAVCLSDLRPVQPAPWVGLVLVRLKILDGWGGVL